MSNFDLALDLASQGVSVFPCRPENGPLDEHGEPQWKEKTPYPGILWRSASTTNESRIRQWWSSYPDAIPAIDLSKSGLVVIDLDRKPGQADGVLAFNDLAESHGDDLADVPKVDTITGGTHLYYRQWAKHGNGRGALPLGVDVRGFGGYVIAPGATMLDGRRYEPEDGYFLEADTPPEWLIDVLSGSREKPAAQFTVEAGPPVSDERKRLYGHAALDADMRSLASAAPGTRNEEANRIAFRIGQLVGGECLTFSEAYAALANAAMSWGIPANDKALGPKGTIARAIRDGSSSPRMPPPDPDVITLAPKPKYVAMEDGTLADPETGEIVPESDYEIDPNPFYWSDPAKLPMREWVYGGHYIRKFLSLTLAPGGVGKSSLTMVEALAMATGEPLLGVQPHGCFNVWLWNGEDPADEMQRRMTAAIMHFGLNHKGLEQCLFMNSGRQTEIIVAREEKGGTKIAFPIVEQVKAAIRRRKIDVLIVDPFVSSHRVSENDNGAIDMVAKLWAKIADETNCSIELVHHVRKTMGGEITVEDGRGASALLAAARSARVLNPMSDDQAAKAGVQSRRGYFKMDNGKSNMAPPPDQSFWFQIVSVPLMNGPLGTNGDNVAVVAPWKWPAPEERNDVDMYAIQEAISGAMNCRADNRSPEWAGNVIAEVMDIDVSDPGNRKIVAGLIEAWVKQGHLKEVIRPDERRRPKPFIEVGKWVEKYNL
ncbi:AAA family ATPase [Bosea sp. AS-1]|uniref:AAA family ATPase n=1 Tax=Bosea sp. AS-1 TaxID=2015316 RepID=UPI0018E021E8|nr:AAA family ATPase [Bosea sp. AS-1]